MWVNVHETKKNTIWNMIVKQCIWDNNKYLSEWMLFNTKWAIILLYHCKNMLYSMTLWRYVRFVLDQHALLDLYSANLLNQKSACGHFSPLGHTILIWDNQSWLILLNNTWNNKCQFYSLWFYPTEARTHNLQLSIRACYSLQHRYSLQQICKI